MRGDLTAPERIDVLLDQGSRVPFGTLFHSDNLSQADETFGHGELDGFGKVDGRWVAYLASDPRVKGGRVHGRGELRGELARCLRSGRSKGLTQGRVGLSSGGNCRLGHYQRSAGGG